MSIKILPPILASQITAGEVIERPSSVVKELVENSLDAGATTIVVEIEDAGKSLIKISDNGFGIEKDQLKLALYPHATSKISEISDLDQILSFGFRGEALASIAAVSRLTLNSKTNQQNEGWCAYQAGLNSPIEIKAKAMSVGTIVEVENLFFNTPARRKFLRANKTEILHIEEHIKRLALAKMDVEFELISNKNAIFKIIPAHDQNSKIKRLQTILGAKFMHDVHEFSFNHAELQLNGYISLSAENQNYNFINGRFIRDKTINHAINQAFSELSLERNGSSCIIFFDLPPNLLDVNVHPAKYEVRFIQPRLIHDFIFQGFFDALNKLQSNQQEALFSNEEANYNDYLNHDSSNYNSSNYENRKASGYNSFNPSRQANQANTRLFEPSVNYSGEAISEDFSNPFENIDNTQISENSTKSVAVNSANQQNLPQMLAMVDNTLLFNYQQKLHVLKITDFYQICINLGLISAKNLLIPLKYKINKQEAKILSKLITPLQKIGFNLTLDNHSLKIFAGYKCLTKLNIELWLKPLCDNYKDEFNEQDILNVILTKVELDNNDLDLFLTNSSPEFSKAITDKLIFINLQEL